MRFTTARIYAVFACILAVVVPSLCQDKARFDFNKFMTSDEQKRTGVARLTPQERAALEEWLTEWTVKVFRIAQEQTGSLGSPGPTQPGTYPGVGGGHWVSKKIDGGRYIQLEDGSLWEISSLDRINTMLWLVTEEITVVESDNPLYPYKLINGDSRDSAEAKLIKPR